MKFGDCLGLGIYKYVLADILFASFFYEFRESSDVVLLL